MKKLLTVKEIAEHFQVSLTCVGCWIKTHKIPFEHEKVKGTKRRRVLSIEDVEKAIQWTNIKR